MGARSFRLSLLKSSNSTCSRALRIVLPTYCSDRIQYQSATSALNPKLIRRAAPVLKYNSSSRSVGSGADVCVSSQCVNDAAIISPAMTTNSSDMVFLLGTSAISRYAVHSRHLKLRRLKTRVAEARSTVTKTAAKTVAARRLVGSGE